MAEPFRYLPTPGRDTSHPDAPDGWELEENELFSFMPRLPLYTSALGAGGVLRWSEAAQKAVADFGGPVRASNGAKAAGEGLRVRGGEHS